MPVPFLLLAETPVFAITNALIIGCYFGRKLINDTELRASFNRALNINSLQIGLVLIYPAFIFGFNSIPSKYQPLYMILMPAIQIVAKNIVSRLVGNYEDMKPVEIIFNIDCFNAIYVSIAMQRATTISTSVIVMLIDAIQACVSVHDVYQRLQPINRYMNKLEVGHPLQGKNFLDVAVALDQEDDVLLRGKQPIYPTSPGPALGTVSVKSSKLSNYGRNASAKVFVAPRKLEDKGTAGEWIYSSESRAAFLLATRKLLFTTEFVILVEYTEVIMPVFYCAHMTVSYYLPNRAFYSNIADIDEHELWVMVTSVLMFATLEFVSLMLIDVALRRITSVSPMRQVGFVLDTKRVQVQSKMLSWVLYAIQLSLDHFGADFSFKFKWLHSH